MSKVYYSYDSHGNKYVTVVSTGWEELVSNQRKEKYTK